MRLPLPALEVFAAIAERGSLRGAAEALDLQPSTVSHQLKSLEARLGTALFIRTTRALSLTEAGRALLRGAGPAFEQLNAAFESARSTGHAARGTLKLALADHVYDLFVGPSLPGFAAAYPEIEIELSLTDALVDILSEGFHAGFRLGDRISQDMIARRMTGPLDLAVVASPEYLAAHGTPPTPGELLQHACVRYRFQSSGRFAPWNFTATDGSGIYAVEVGGGLILNTLPASLDAARRGLGLVYTFRDVAAADIASGRLVEVLADHLPQTPGVFLYYPREYRSMLPLRLFYEHLREVTRAASAS